MSDKPITRDAGASKNQFTLCKSKPESFSPSLWCVQLRMLTCWLRLNTGEWWLMVFWEKQFLTLVIVQIWWILMLHTLNFPLSHISQLSSLLPIIQSKTKRARWSSGVPSTNITPLLLMLQFFFPNLTFLAKKIPQDTHYCNLAFTQVDAMPQFSA